MATIKVMISGQTSLQATMRPMPFQRQPIILCQLTILGFAYLSFNSGMAIHRSQGDRGAIAFVSFSYLDLLALFYCLSRFESAEPGSALRDRLKVAVWLLTTALTVLFSYKVAAVMPAAVALVVWIMAFGTVARGFLTFFCYDKQ
ncbi:hypothetical protein BAE44_0019731 [Dichanthelium oligosanthes]|uniref:Uncharacterized protein n=1 Tax=Dichanthelium oligosanthes TaxID=888268 RepID=A0A1E5V275_9POAL|nr:hypothetical protein BAE44_0019731 [Dichanthelium oligosanthes]